MVTTGATAVRTLLLCTGPKSIRGSAQPVAGWDVAARDVGAWDVAGATADDELPPACSLEVPASQAVSVRIIASAKARATFVGGVTTC
jgi:hypothetical protein